MKKHPAFLDLRGNIESVNVTNVSTDDEKLIGLQTKMGTVFVKVEESEAKIIHKALEKDLTNKEV